MFPGPLVRNGGIARRLVYTVLSKAYGPNFARMAHDDAKEKAHQELLPTDWLESPQFEPEELKRFDELAQAYAQELSERGLIPDLPPMDMHERFLVPEPEKTIDLDHHIDR